VNPAARPPCVGTLTGINLDMGSPTVAVNGPWNGATFRGHVPKARCVAHESLSGIASCKLRTSKKKTPTGYRETVTATATTKANVSKTARVTFTVEG
jgi:hypothetical protein